MKEKCDNCGNMVIPYKKEYSHFEGNISEYRCPICGDVLRSVTIEK